MAFFAVRMANAVVCFSLVSRCAPLSRKKKTFKYAMCASFSPLVVTEMNHMTLHGCVLYMNVCTYDRLDLHWCVCVSSRVVGCHFFSFILVIMFPPSLLLLALAFIRYIHGNFWPNSSRSLGTGRRDARPPPIGHFFLSRHHTPTHPHPHTFDDCHFSPKKV